MAVEHDFDSDDYIFAGEDKTLVFEIFDTDGATMKDVTGWALEWVLKRHTGESAAVLSKTTTAGGITISGVFNATRASNTQRVNVALTDTDTEGLEARTYQHALRRTDAGSETVLSFGRFVLRKAAAV